MYINCRLCASKIKSCSIKDSNKLKYNELGLFVYKYLEIRTTDNDEVPNIACELCCEVLFNFNKFLKKLKIAQQKLKEIFTIQTANIVDIKLEQEPNDRAVKTEIEETLADSNVESVGIKNEIDFETDYDHFEFEFTDEGQNDFISNKSSCDKSDNLENPCHTLLKNNDNVSKLSTPINVGNSDIKNNSSNANKVRKIEFKCHKCNLMVQTDGCLQEHFKIVHNSKTEYVCLKCNALFDDYKVFEKHLYEHYLRRITKYLRFTCEICGKKFKNKTSLTAHEDVHLGIKRFSCNECGKQFRLKHQLTDHEFTHKTIEKKDFKVKCDQCDKICNSAHLLERHMRTHIPKEEKYKYQCEKCDRKFVSVENYNNHQKLHENEKEKENICDHCGKVFKVKGNFLEHIKISHSNERPFGCDQCSKSFKTERALKAHKTIHLDEKPYGCEVCGKKFRTKHNLDGHFAVHTEELPFECNFCHKRFKRKPCLKVHLRQHTGERPYSCTECNHFFANSANFIKHLKRKHGLENVSISNKFEYPFINE